MNTQPRSRVTHELKIWPEFFKWVRNGRMLFQLRRNDRDFKVGDQLLLREWDPTTKVVAAVPDGEGGTCIFPCEPEPQGSTGREILVRVDYIMDAETVRKTIHPLLGLMNGMNLSS